jgi:ATP-dependent RNA helicase DBP3
VGIAQTGSGKTLAFGLPGLFRIKKNYQLGDSIVPKMLVLAPTRELATQIFEVINSAGNEAGIKVVCIFGGVSKQKQEMELRDGMHVIVATPGRLLDFLRTKVCDLSHVDFLVLDEADRMLDMGFERDIKDIMSYVPNERQTAMFSATWPAAIQSLADNYIQNPIRVTIGSSEGKLVANSDVTQIVEVIDDRARDAKLFTLLRDYHKSRKNKILIFVLYKTEASRLETLLNNKGWNCVAIHADKKTTE